MVDSNNGENAEQMIRQLISFIGDNPSREGLEKTPHRVVKSYAELFSGYADSAERHLTTFEDGSCDEMVILKDIEMISFCEHHMLPFTGKAHIAYIPYKRVIGVSKLARILEVYSRRLQIQERISQQVTAALDSHLKPRGSACIIEAKHSCMSCRGVRKQHSVMITSSLTGAFKSDPAAKAELLHFIQ